MEDENQGLTLTIEQNDVYDQYDDEAAVNQYVADLAVSGPLSADKPLWKMRLLIAHKCIFFRIHNALGDGISLMSMLMASCRKAGDANELPVMVPEKTTAESKGVKREKIIYKGGDGVEFGHRKMATARSSLDDMKEVKSQFQKLQPYL